jgi:hypothetical protein
MKERMTMMMMKKKKKKQKTRPIPWGASRGEKGSLIIDF